MAATDQLSHLDGHNVAELQRMLAHKLSEAPTATAGLFVYNTTTKLLEYSDGTSWIPVYVDEAGDALTRTGKKLDVAVGTGLEISSDAVRIAAAAAGAGLVGGAGSALAVGAGTGITVNADDVAVNTSLIATRLFVEELIQGVDKHATVRVATTANITIATALNSGDIIDGVTLANGDRVLVKNQTTKKENGIYVVAASPARAGDADATGELKAGSMVYVDQGETQKDTGWWITTNEAITIGTTEIEWAQFNGVGDLIAGTGLTKTGNEVNVVANADNSLKANANDLQVNSAIVPFLALANIFTGNQRINGGGAEGPLTLQNGESGSQTILKLLTGAGVLRGLVGYLKPGGEGEGPAEALQISSALAIQLTSEAAQVDVANAKVTRVKKGTEPKDAVNLEQAEALGRYSANIGDGSKTEIEVEHKLNSRDVSIEVYRNSTPWDTVNCIKQRVSTEKVKLIFLEAPSSEQFRVVVKR